MSEMTSGLVERIEEATGPDRELDIAIARLVFNVAADMHPLRDWVKAFTASIDAAMTLVPEGWRFMVGQREFPHARAYVENGKPSFVGMGNRRNPERLWFETTAATPALALCAAALRARAPLPAPPAKDTIV